MPIFIVYIKDTVMDGTRRYDIGVGRMVKGLILGHLGGWCIGGVGGGDVVWEGNDGMRRRSLG